MAKSFEQDTEDEVMGYLQMAKDIEPQFQKMLQKTGGYDMFSMDMDSIYGEISSDIEKDPARFKKIVREAEKSGINPDDTDEIDRFAQKLYAKYQD